MHPKSEQQSDGDSLHPGTGTAQRNRISTAALMAT